MFAGISYSLSFMFQDGLVDGYKYSHIIPTPVYNDHISFSMSVALTIGWFLFLQPAIAARWCRNLLLVSAVLMAAYLHVLAAKTGLVAFYILIAALLLRTVIRSPRTGVVMTLVAVATIAASIVYIPTLRERVGYTMVTFRSLSQGERNGIYSDAGRIISYDLALRSIRTHPWTGVGAGDVFDVMREGYRRHYPEVAEPQQIWPHNQFLIFAMAAGIPCVALFFGWYMTWLSSIRRDREGFFRLTQWLMLLVPLMVDVFLEVQFGVCVFLVFLLLHRLSARSPQATADIHDKLHPRFPPSDRRVSGRIAQPSHL
jgi:O-antigen ligase